MGRGGSFEVVDGGNGARGMNRHGQRCLPNGTCWPLLEYDSRLWIERLSSKQDKLKQQPD